MALDFISSLAGIMDVKTVVLAFDKAIPLLFHEKKLRGVAS